MSYLDILSERQGWGNQATGGKDGVVVFVASSAEFTTALGSSQPLWIRFKAPMTLTGPYKCGANKTIDGRDFPGLIRMTGEKGGMRIEGVGNVIVIGVNFDGGWAKYTEDTEGADGVQVRNASDLWFHHCRFAQWADGCLDAKEGSKNLSVTWSRFDKHNQALLWMANPATLAYCYATNIGKRFPKSVGGRMHAYNNVIAKWRDVEIECARDNGQLLSENSVWLPGTQKKVGLVVAGGVINSKGHLASGVTFLNKGTVNATFASQSRSKAKVVKADANLRAAVEKGAGPTRTIPTPTV
jgi:pectate lyase